MQIKSKAQAGNVVGIVRGHFFNPVTGETRNDFVRKNITTYSAADITAKLLGGESQYAPKYMGFIYGTTSSPGLADPDSPPERNQPWEDIQSEVLAINKGNILVAPLSSVPVFSVDGGSDIYSHNSLELVAHSGSEAEYAFSGSAYAGDFIAGNYVYHGLILTKLTQGSSVTYIPYARVTLNDGGYPTKPSGGWELALFWSISIY